MQPFHIYTSSSPAPIASWTKLLERLTNNTCEVARKLFCEAYSTSLDKNRTTELDLKTLLDIPTINKKAILNLIDSAEEITCTDLEMLQKWSLEPCSESEDSSRVGTLSFHFFLLWVLFP